MKRLVAMLLLLGVASGCGSKTPDAATVKKHMQPAQLALGDPVVNSIGMVLVPIPAGAFTMGDDDQELANLHRVKISKPFHLGAFEVTQGQYEKVMGKNPSKFNGPQFKHAKDLPVETVTWEDAIEFCRKLSALPEEKAAGRAYRLPTEAEWEYACRAGTTTKFSFGDDKSKLDECAWHAANSDGQTHVFGQKSPNAWGLYDMHGNVFEWCEDWYGDYPSGSATDPTGPKSGRRRVCRGGSWFNDARHCRSGDRFGNFPGIRNIHNGFRVAQVPLSDKRQASEAESESR